MQALHRAEAHCLNTCFTPDRGTLPKCMHYIIKGTLTEWIIYTGQRHTVWIHAIHQQGHTAWMHALHRTGAHCLNAWLNTCFTPGRGTLSEYMHYISRGTLPECMHYISWGTLPECMHYIIKGTLTEYMLFQCQTKVSKSRENYPKKNNLTNHILWIYKI